MGPRNVRTHQICQNALGHGDVVARLAAAPIDPRQVSAATGRMGGPTPA